MRGTGALTGMVVAAAVLAGCTPARSPLPVPDPTATTPSRAPADRTAVPTPRPAPTFRMPLALAVHATRPASDVSAGTARTLSSGALPTLAVDGTKLRVIRATSLAASRAALARVAKDPSLVAVVPAAAVTPRVRVLTVGRVDPLRDPRRYPLTTTWATRVPEVTTSPWWAM